MIQRDRSVNWKTVVEITQFEQKKKEKKINKDHGRDLWDNIKDSTIYIREVPKEEETENVFENIIAVHFPNLGKETDIKEEEPHRIPYKINLNKLITWHYKMTNTKNKENLKNIKKNSMSYVQENYHQTTIWLFSRSLQTRREWNDIFKVIKEKNLNQVYSP